MKIGDKVCLKSGGPVMTVAAIQKDDPKMPKPVIIAEAAATMENERLIGCVWWNFSRSEFMDKAFPRATLEPAEDKPQDKAEDWSKAS